MTEHNNRLNPNGNPPNISYDNLRLNTPTLGGAYIADDYMGGGVSTVQPKKSLDKSTARHYAQNVFDHITGICAEKNVSDMVDIVCDEPHKKQYNIYYTADKIKTTPHLMIKWWQDNNVVKIHMNQHVKPLRKQIKIDKPEKYDAIINTVIDILVAQNESYNETKAMIENCVAEFNLDVEPEYIRRTKTLWHVSYKKGTLLNSIVIQYDERSKEFLFQKRYITGDDVVDLVNTTSRTI